MDRRTLLKTGTLAGIAALVPQSSLFAQQEAERKTNNKIDLSGFRKIK